MRLLLNVGIFLNWYFAHVTNGQGPYKTVKLKNGSPVQGRMIKTVTGKTVMEFLGIPFAEPPLGPLRFKHPVPKNPWTKTYKADALPKACYQSIDTLYPGFQGAEMWNPNTNLSEDCLYLNVWVPVTTLKPSAKKLPIMFWIYGGGFFSGSSALELYDGKILASEENVIVVSTNYRVGVFGFLYGGNSEMPGNAGLLDQLEALKWVRNNIGFFGGDPSEVTLFGESSGSASVSLHSLSPLSQPYFKRFILESAAATNPWTVFEPEVAVQNALSVGEQFQCNVQRAKPDWRKLADCLRKQNAQNLVDKQWVTEGFMVFPWAPVIDSYFLVENPLTSLNRGTFKPGQVLLGTTSQEGNYFIVYGIQRIFGKDDIFTKNDFLTSDALFDEAVYEVLPEKYRKNPALRNAASFEYKDWEWSRVTALKRQDSLDRLVGDYQFTCPVIEFAQKYTQAGNTAFYYYFPHFSSVQTWPRWMGALNGYEINFVFGEPLKTDKYRYTKEEQELSQKFMRYWANFARTGNPNKNPDNSWTQENWPEYGKDQKHLVLSVNRTSVGNGLNRRKCSFWNIYLNQLKAQTVYEHSLCGKSRKKRNSKL